MKRGVLFDGFKTPKINDKSNIKKLVGKTRNPKSKSRSSRGLSLEECMKRVKEHSLKVAERLPMYTFDLITDEQTLSDYLDVAVDNGVLSLDTETTGLSIDDKVVGLCIYTPGMNPSYVPYKHLNYEYNVNVLPFLERVQTLSQTEELIVPMAHAPFDQRRIKKTFNMSGYIRCLWDVQIAAKFLDENLRRYNLKFLWEYYVMKMDINEIKPDSYKTLFGTHSFDEFNPEDVITYPALDGLMTYQVYEFQYDFLGESGKNTDAVGLRSAVETHKMWSRLSEVVSGMMDNGVNIDDEAIEHLRQLLEAQSYEKHLTFDSCVDEIAEEFLTPLMNNDPELFSKIERPLNPASPSQLSILFYDAMKLHRFKKRSVDEATVERLVKKYPQYSKMFNVLIDYRKVQKLLSTYVEGLQKRKNKYTGKIHTKFKIYGARTGRYSSSDPNLQNIPVRTELGRQIRRTFIPSEGHYFIGSDYS
jgi:DNA polymerase-1